jgi:hypothetical protein
LRKPVHLDNAIKILLTANYRDFAISDRPRPRRVGERLFPHRPGSRWGGFLESLTRFDGMTARDYQAHTIALPAWYGTQMTVLKRGGQIMKELTPEEMKLTDRDLTQAGPGETGELHQGTPRPDEPVIRR